MEMPDHAWMTNLPSGAQIAINAATFLVALFGGLLAYMSSVRKGKLPRRPRLTALHCQ